MQAVRRIAEEIVAREGGFVDDPDDPGGATKYGVTIGTMRRLGLDLDGDGRVGTADVRALTRTQAADIFIEHYFRRPGIARLPEALQASVFDMYVNSGDRAVRLLQGLLGNMGFALDIDGFIGPHTVAAAADAAKTDPLLLRDAYGIARRNFYFGLADARAASRKYARSRAGGKGGWIRRAESFLSPRFHLSAAEFQRRISEWE